MVVLFQPGPEFDIRAALINRGAYGANSVKDPSTSKVIVSALNVLNKMRSIEWWIHNDRIKQLVVLPI